ncbi:RimK family alpha-L-glutamate ligase [Pseudodesulfovibrio sp. JC047]|uniref:RimK family alpha-L-glutamate ligase n=1 Tax=Pseudodesulfovibrio sp. JC047 TaxID=2683199 RepID=UPI0013CFF48B|nr:RimK family alpha-L-glutamate ligase [Pseudodesulfovibrio sp. JC047]NDV19446.1 RimK family alpha-L-glutamate ligase [Pseudodesulfovibrio sp. JC047]
MKAVILGKNGGKHTVMLQEALAARGVKAPCLPMTRITARPGQDPLATLAGQGTDDRRLADADVVFVRCVPGGSLEQVIYRLDILHTLVLAGKRVVNPPVAIERGADKYLSFGLLAKAGLPVPKTIVTERVDEAMVAFHELGGDVVVKPLFGAEGRGMTRVQDPDVAYRVFKALELGGYIYYLQEFLEHQNEDIRLFVVGGEVIAAMRRQGTTWKTNISVGAKGVALTPDREMTDMALRAASVIGAEYAGVDIMVTNGEYRVIEVNSIPAWAGLKAATGVDAGAALVEYVLEGSG